MRIEIKNTGGDIIAEFSADVFGSTYGDVLPAYNIPEIDNIEQVETIIYDLLSGGTWRRYFPKNVYGIEFFIEIVPHTIEFYLAEMYHRFTMSDAVEGIYTGAYNDAASATAAACCEALTPWHFNAVKPWIKYIFEHKSDSLAADIFNNQ